MHFKYVKNMNMLEDTTVDIQVKYHVFPASLFTRTLLSTVFLPTPNKRSESAGHPYGNS